MFISEFWKPVVGEVAIVVLQEENRCDHYAVVILEEGTICTVGHIPCIIAKEGFYFLKTGGNDQSKNQWAV